MNILTKLTTSELAELLYTSSVQPSERPTTDEVLAAIEAEYRKCAGDCGQCAACMAEDAAKAPEQCAARMRWCRAEVSWLLIEEVTGMGVAA